LTSRAHRRARRRAKAEAMAANGMADIDREQIYRPKEGPGVVIKRELLSEVASGHAKTKRYRNIGSTPLRLAYHRGALVCDSEREWRAAPTGKVCPAILADDRLDCGEKFEQHWYARMGVSHGDSTVPRVSGGGGSRSMTELQQEAGEEIERLRKRMAERNYLIVEGMCGMGYSMLDALRYAGVQAHPVGTAYRVREAFDDLVCAMTGRRIVPMLVPGKAAHPA
jgi:hypothetical protein